MTREMGFLVALCVTTGVCYALLSRASRLRAERRFAPRTSGGDSGNAGLSSSSDGWSAANWFSDRDSSSGFSDDSSGNGTDLGSCGGSSDSGGGSGDSGGGGGDCGGGGDGND